MAFDGGMLKKIIDELKIAVDSHVEKIYQPSRDELVFLLRSKGFSGKLLICARPGAARVHLTEQRYENPDSPPMFCMLLRKRLSSARLVDITQNGLERVAEFHFSAVNEMGDRIPLRIVCELIGSKPNVILLNGDGRIVDSLRRSDIESGARMIQPGARYEYPARVFKTNPLTSEPRQIAEMIVKRGDIPLSKAVIDTIDGFSPLICREVAHRAAGQDIAAKDADPTALAKTLEGIIGDLANGLNPVLLSREGIPFEFTYTGILQYGDMVKSRKYPDFSSLLDAFYSERDKAERLSRAANDILKLVGNLRSRTEKKLYLRLEELKNCKNREQLRIYGELLKANMYRLQKGAGFIEVENYYDENLAKVRIPLNPALSPTANAAKYFKDYKKSYNAEQTLTRLTNADREELSYFDSVLESISRCESLSDLAEIREELADAGYIKRANLAKRKKDHLDSKFREFYSKEGYKILVGKNNRQNDYLTTKLASKNDLWFHVKNMPGSHVVVFCSGGPVSDETLLKAASLAAFYSKASCSSQVPVDYTYIKYVKKPGDAKPGMVIYQNNKTLFVTPTEVTE